MAVGGALYPLSVLEISTSLWMMSEEVKNGGSETLKIGQHFHRLAVLGALEREELMIFMVTWVSSQQILFPFWLSL